jgi:hypothetical protein
MEITVRVVDSDDEERTFSGIKVIVYAKEPKQFWQQWKSFIEYTDGDGESFFDIEDDDIDADEGVLIEVRGTEHGPYEICDGGRYTFNIPY